MADTLDIVTLSEAKDGLNLNNTTRYDDELALWITAVSRRLDQLVGPVVQRTVSTEAHTGGDHEIYLAQHPISSITSVTEYHGGDGTTARTLTAETNASKPLHAYKTTPYSADRTLLGSKLRRRSSNADAIFEPGDENIEVTYVAGRAATTAAVDERYKIGASLILQHLWHTQRPDTTTVGTGEFEVPTQRTPRWAIPRAVRAQLDGLFPGEIQDPLPL